MLAVKWDSLSSRHLSTLLSILALWQSIHRMRSAQSRWRSLVTMSHRCFSCCETLASVLTTDRNSHQMALISVVPTVHQVALAASSVAVAAAAAAVVDADRLCRRLIVPDCCTVSPTLAARCHSVGHACSHPTLGSSPGQDAYRHLYF